METVPYPNTPVRRRRRDTGISQRNCRQRTEEPDFGTYLRLGSLPEGSFVPGDSPMDLMYPFACLKERNVRALATCLADDFRLSRPTFAVCDDESVLDSAARLYGQILLGARCAAKGDMAPDQSTTEKLKIMVQSIASPIPRVYAAKGVDGFSHILRLESMENTNIGNSIAIFHDETRSWMILPSPGDVFAECFAKAQEHAEGSPERL